MQEFSFYNPTRIEFGLNKEEKIGEFLKEFKAKRVLIVFGSNRIRKDGFLDKIEDLLQTQDIEFKELSGVKSNPVLSKVKEGIKLACEFKADSVLAIGGGSVLDSAKAIAAGVKYDGDVWDFCLGKIPQDALMIFDIMTLAATASEMNNGAVITNEETKEKFSLSGDCLFPKVSIINPSLQASVPRNYLVYSAADIIAHSIEAYFTSKTRVDLVDLYVEANIKTVIKTTDILLKNPKDLDARGEFAWAATMALNGLTHKGIGGFSFPNHMLEHAIGAHCDCPHGAGLSVIMLAWMRWYEKQNEKQFKRFAKEIFGLQSGREGINALEAWFKSIGTPTRLAELNLDENDVQIIISSLIPQAKKRGLGELYTKENLEEIFDLAF